MEGTGVPATASGALSEGIKMAMKSVKPLKKKYVIARTKVSKCPSEEDIQSRIDAAVTETQGAADTKLKKAEEAAEAKYNTLEQETNAKIEALELTRTKLNEYIRTNKEQFNVE